MLPRSSTRPVDTGTMTRFLNIAAGLIYVLWLVIGGLHAAAGPTADAARQSPVLAGNLH